MHKAKKYVFLLVLLLLLLTLTFPAYAASEEDAANVSAEDVTPADESDGIGLKALAVGLAIGIAAAGGAVAMGIVSGKSVEGLARQPEAEGKIRTMMMLGLVFIETAIIYALLVIILIIFVM